MKSDVVTVTNSGEGIGLALQAASASALYRGLGKKEAIRVRLLAEEMLGLVRQITGETEAEFWVESEGSAFQLHLNLCSFLSGKMRRELIKSSSSGKNEAARGFIGMLRDMVDRALGADDEDDPFADYRWGMVMPTDMDMIDPMLYASSAGMMHWSMQNYMTNIRSESTHDEKAKAEWDELERSILVNLADEVKVAVNGNKVEMTVYKNFENK